MYTILMNMNYHIFNSRFEIPTLHFCLGILKAQLLQIQYWYLTLKLNYQKLYYNGFNGVLTSLLCARNFSARIGCASHLRAHKREKLQGS